MSDVVNKKSSIVGQGDTQDIELSFRDLLATVPDIVREYLLAPETEHKRAQIYSKFNLTPDEREIVLYTEHEIFFGISPIADFPDLLWSRLPWGEGDEAKAQQLVVEIAGRIFLPAEVYLGDVRGLLDEFNANAGDFPQDKIKLQKLTVAQLVLQILTDSGIASSVDDESRKRVEKTLESFIRGVRDEAETREFLMKPVKTGGAGLVLEQTDDVMSRLLAASPRTIIVGEEVAKKKTSSAVKKYTPEEIKRMYLGDDDEREVLKASQKMFMDGIASDPIEIRKKFSSLLSSETASREMWLVVAGLLLLVESGSIGDALHEDERLRGLVIQFLKEKKRNEEAERCEKNPADPRFVSLFVQIVLRRFAGMDAANAARFGLRIGNLLKKHGYPDLADIAAFSMEEGQFVWLKPEQM
jgi:hypothetical protein